MSHTHSDESAQAQNSSRATTTLVSQPPHSTTLLLDWYWTYFSKHYIYITKKLPNLVAKILATKFGFVPDCWRVDDAKVLQHQMASLGHNELNIWNLIKQTWKISATTHKDHSVYAPSQWETALCNAVSYWLGTHTEWSLHTLPPFVVMVFMNNICFTSQERPPRAQHFPLPNGTGQVKL